MSASVPMEDEPLDRRSRLPVLVRRALRSAGPPAIAAVVLLVLWELAVRNSDLDPTLFVTPSAIALKIPEVVASDMYAESVSKTLRLLGIGFATATVLGISIGMLLGRVRLLDRALSPWMFALYSAPIPAIVPLLTATVGFAFTAKLIIVVLLGVFPILINSKQGVQEVDKGLLEVAHSFRASEFHIQTQVVLPSAVPFILVGLRLGAVRSLIGTIVAEFYTSPGGLGYMIMVFARRFDNASMFTPVLTLTILGLLLVGAVRLVERRLNPWQASS